jgi:hypothetical protein
MSASDWIASLTSLPRRIIGSLGPTKRDLAPIGSHTYYEPATEKEIMRNWLGWLAELCGLPSGYAATSLQGRLDALEVATDDPHAFIFREPFIGAKDAPLGAPWGTIGGNDWQYSGTRGGGAWATLDDAKLAALLAVLHRSQAPRVRLSVVVTKSPGTGVQFEFVSDDGHEAFGVRLETESGTKLPLIRAFIRTGDTETVTNTIGMWVANAEQDLDLVVSAAGACTVALAGGTPVALGTLADVDVQFLMITAADGAGGGIVRARAMLATADWTVGAVLSPPA